MFQTKSKKLMSLTLCGLMSAGIFGTTLAGASRAEAAVPAAAAAMNTSASSFNYLSHRYSKGEMITAGIVGAVVGAVIAKNT